MQILIPVISFAFKAEATGSSSILLDFNFLLNNARGISVKSLSEYIFE